MTETSVEEITERLKETVRTLFRAENGPGDHEGDDYLAPPHNTTEGIWNVADRILASDYLPIVRGKGQVDIDRKDTLKKIAAGSPGFVRHISRAEIQVNLFMDNHVAIVRSLLPATDSRDPPTIEVAFRNIHVFQSTNAGWQCLAWQVTKVG